MLPLLKWSTSLSSVLIRVSGCGSGESSVSSYQSTGQSASDALTAAFDARKSGRAAPGTIATGKPTLEVLDSV